MENKTCYKCGKLGHFANVCPEKSSIGFRKNPYFDHPVTSTAEFPATQCPCGAGFCVIKTQFTDFGTRISKYHCPGKSGMDCMYWKRCDMVKKEEIRRTRPLVPYPICKCGAGVCRIEEQKYRADAGRKYFACRVPKGQGACSFRQWMDDYYQTEIKRLQDATNTDDAIANEIRMICKELESGEIDLDDFTYPSEEPLVEMEINSSAEIYGRDGGSSPSPSPTDQGYFYTGFRGGLCIIKASAKRNGRLYYSCPGTHDMVCGYAKWCDEMSANEILQTRPRPFPICPCGAGMCRVEVQRSGPNAGRYYFACRIPMGQGSCNFFEWKNDYDEITLSEAFEDWVIPFESTSEEALSV